MMAESDAVEDHVPLFMVYKSQSANRNLYSPNEIIEIAVQCLPLPDTPLPSFHSLVYPTNSANITAKRFAIRSKKKGAKFPDAISALLQWCAQTVDYANESTGLSHYPVLLAHGGFYFDFIILFREMEACDISLDIFRENNIYFSDSSLYLLYEKKILSHPLLVDTRSLSLESLLNDWFPGQYIEGYHQPHAITTMVIRLFRESPLSQFVERFPVFVPEECIQYYKDRMEKRRNKETLIDKLEPLLNAVECVFVVKELMENGLTFDTLKELYIGCASHEHFRQELKYCKIKSSSGNKIARYFVEMGLQQEGTIQPRPVAVVVYPPVRIQPVAENPILAVAQDCENSDQELEYEPQAGLEHDRHELDTECGSQSANTAPGANDQTDCGWHEVSSPEIDYPMTFCSGNPDVIPEYEEVSTPTLIRTGRRSTLFDEDYEERHYAGCKPKINWKLVAKDTDNIRGDSRKKISREGRSDVQEVSMVISRPAGKFRQQVRGHFFQGSGPGMDRCVTGLGKSCEEFGHFGERQKFHRDGVADFGESGKERKNQAWGKSDRLQRSGVDRSEVQAHPSNHRKYADGGKGKVISDSGDISREVAIGKKTTEDNAGKNGNLQKQDRSKKEDHIQKDESDDSTSKNSDKQIDHNGNSEKSTELNSDGARADCAEDSENANLFYGSASDQSAAMYKHASERQQHPRSMSAWNRWSMVPAGMSRVLPSSKSTKGLRKCIDYGSLVDDVGPNLHLRVPYPKTTGDGCDYLKDRQTSGDGDRGGDGVLTEREVAGNQEDAQVWKVMVPLKEAEKSDNCRLSDSETEKNKPALISISAENDQNSGFHQQNDAKSESGKTSTGARKKRGRNKVTDNSKIGPERNLSSRKEDRQNGRTQQKDVKSQDTVNQKQDKTSKNTRSVRKKERDKAVTDKNMTETREYGETHRRSAKGSCMDSDALSNNSDVNAGCGQQPLKGQQPPREKPKDSFPPAKSCDRPGVRFEYQRWSLDFKKRRGGRQNRQQCHGRNYYWNDPSKNYTDRPLGDGRGTARPEHRGSGRYGWRVNHRGRHEQVREFVDGYNPHCGIDETTKDSYGRGRGDMMPENPGAQTQAKFGAPTGGDPVRMHANFGRPNPRIAGGGRRTPKEMKKGCHVSVDDNNNWRKKDFDISDILPYKNEAYGVLLGYGDAGGGDGALAARHDELIMMYNKEFLEKK